MGRIAIGALVLALVVLGAVLFRSTVRHDDKATTHDTPSTGNTSTSPRHASRAAAAKAQPDGSTTAAPADSRVVPQATDSPRDELAAMERLRKGLQSSDPAVTLELARELDGKYPDSPLAQERSLYIVDAFIAQNRIPEARAEARRHLERWPGTGTATRVMARTGVHPTPGPPPGYR